MITYESKWPRQDVLLCYEKKKHTPTIPDILLDRATFLSLLARDTLGMIADYSFREATQRTILLGFEAAKLSEKDICTKIFDTPSLIPFCRRRVRTVEVIDTRKRLANLWMKASTEHKKIIVKCQADITANFFTKFLEKIHFDEIKEDRIHGVTCAKQGSGDTYIVNTPFVVKGLNEPLFLEIKLDTMSIKLFPQELYITVISETNFEILPYKEIITFFRNHIYNHRPTISSE